LSIVRESFSNRSLRCDGRCSKPTAIDTRDVKDRAFE
jgi:hypothetical protein